jgi:Na+-translocating ferredoxin:NAD+ oxidoreductase RnfC subunit
MRAHPLVEERRTPLKRLMNRLGVVSFVNRGPLIGGVGKPHRVLLPLKQHAGAPAEPTVKIGDRVRTGDMVADSPEGKLGACIHASIDGRIVSIDGAIVIER